MLALDEYSGGPWIGVVAQQKVSDAVWSVRETVVEAVNCSYALGLDGDH